MMLSVFKRPGAVSLAVPSPPSRYPSRHRSFSTPSALRTAPRRTRDLSSSFSTTYDPDEEGRGPMFNKNTCGVPQFYPRDLKKRVDEYVVGQERAKKTISSVIFNHYQGVRRRNHQDELERKRQETLQRRNEARDRMAREREPMHPVEGSLSNDSVRNLFGTDEYLEDEFPGHNDSVKHTHQTWLHREQEDDFYVPEDTSRPQSVKIDKSNLMLIGPTGVGKTYILE
jgi:ATP-dependent Clp protease ATP-binding subunit ClpX